MFKLVVQFVVVIILCLLTALAIWIQTTPSYLESARAIHFPLIMALDIYKEKTGHYPKKIAELHQFIPTFDASPFIGYDRYDECIVDSCYSLEKNGEYIIGYGVSGGITCWMDSTKRVDFDCHD